MLFAQIEAYRLQAKFGCDSTHMKKRGGKKVTWLSVT